MKCDNCTGICEDYCERVLPNDAREDQLEKCWNDYMAAREAVLAARKAESRETKAAA